MKGLKTFRQFFETDVRKLTAPERVLIEAIAALSSHPNYSKLTPQEILDTLADYALKPIRPLVGK